MRLYPTVRFPSPLIEPDVRISRIRLSDCTMAAEAVYFAFKPHSVSLSKHRLELPSRFDVKSPIGLTREVWPMTPSQQFLRFAADCHGDLQARPAKQARMAPVGGAVDSVRRVGRA